MNTMKTNAGEGDHRPRYTLGSNQPRWRLWFARAVVFSVTLVLLMTVFSSMSGIVEKFFITLYVD